MSNLNRETAQQIAVDYVYEHTINPELIDLYEYAYEIDPGATDEEYAEFIDVIVDTLRTIAEYLDSVEASYFE